ncbi:MAG: acylneuraminate cytidylyltransferase family protein [Lachnospiraceae bacterium]|nr:acylneuraminate cytidylyltransferase family protein [Lachnospiraceae bacterium]
MNKLIVIPARGGSKGIPKKNIYPLNGKPLLSYTLEMITKACLKDVDVVVSTDAEDIRRVALNNKNVFVIDRPTALASDKASTEDTLIHAIDIMQKKTEKKYEAVITLQPTSPLRKAETLEAFINEYEKVALKYDALVSFSEDRTDFWVLDAGGEFERLYPDAPRRRQERKPLYRENSAYYITNVNALFETHSVLGKKAGGFIISETEGIDINEFIDLKVAEAILND